jgi:hypothetical protein
MEQLHLLPADDAIGAVVMLREQPGGDIGNHGEPVRSPALIEHDLVHESAR